jgi:hypothetical protein
MLSANVTAPAARNLGNHPLIGDSRVSLLFPEPSLVLSRTCQPVPHSVPGSALDLTFFLCFSDLNPSSQFITAFLGANSRRQPQSLAFSGLSPVWTVARRVLAIHYRSFSGITLLALLHSSAIFSPFSWLISRTNTIRSFGLLTLSSLWLYILA